MGEDQSNLSDPDTALSLYQSTFTSFIVKPQGLKVAKAFFSLFVPVSFASYCLVPSVPSQKESS
jgi:hypothetical protein